MADISLSDIDIVIQMTLLLMLVYGYYSYTIRHNFKHHGIILTAATFVNLIAIILLMLPHLNFILSRNVDVDLDFLIIVAHSVIGGIAAVLSAYIVARWFVHGRDSKACRGRMLMNATFFSWLVSLLMGFGLYFFG